MPSILFTPLPCTFNIPKTRCMFSQYTHWIHARNIFRNIYGPILSVIGDHILDTCWDYILDVPQMWLVDTSGLYVEVTFQMYPKCDWWLHWGESDPEPAIYPRCSHWFPGHLTPSVSGSDPWWIHCKQNCERTQGFHSKCPQWLLWGGHCKSNQHVITGHIVIKVGDTLQKLPAYIPWIMCGRIA